MLARNRGRPHGAPRFVRLQPAGWQAGCQGYGHDKDYGADALEEHGRDCQIDHVNLLGQEDALPGSAC